MENLFDKPVKRRGTGSLKWDVAENELPMWVADMDFETAPPVKEAILKRAEHGVFGYTDITPEWYSAYQSWWKDRHGFEMEKEWLIFTTGVVPAISSIVRKMTTVAENVVVMTPVYNIFFNSILNNGRNVLESRLKYENGAYQIDFDDLEEKLANPQTSLLLLCNPHNPVGKIWDREELKRIGEYAGNIMYWCFLTKSTAILQSRARTIVRLLRYLKRVKITVLHVLRRQKHLILRESRRRQ